jgi:septum formation protein
MFSADLSGQTFLMTTLILASRSPRRRELIRLLGYPFQSFSTDVDESSITHSDPAVNVMETAALKAQAMAKQVMNDAIIGRHIIVAADTTVSLNGEMLGKPVDAADADRMLRDLRHRTHRVHTGINLIDLKTGQKYSDVHTAVVIMRNYSDEEIAAYVASGDPMDKAGAYAIQHPTFRPVAGLHGCFTGVMGLSICHLIHGLNHFGLPLVADLPALQLAHQQYYCPLFEQISRSPS